MAHQDFLLILYACIVVGWNVPCERNILNLDLNLHAPPQKKKKKKNRKYISIRVDPVRNLVHKTDLHFFIYLTLFT